MDEEELRRAVAGITWYHSIPLPYGIVTPGIDDSPRRAPTLGIPDDFTGKSVLDVGAWDGFFSFESERRGAARVLATDHFCWSGEGWGTRAGFDLAREALGSRVEDKDIDVMDLSPEAVGVFDVVLFLGVLYHLRHPLLALERIASVTGEMLVLDTHVDLTWMNRPVMAFYPGTELNRDPTNWWGPNPRAVEAMLRDVGFRKVRQFSPPTRLAIRLLRTLDPQERQGKPLAELARDRAVFHAWR